MAAPGSSRWSRLIGIYDADSGLLGELAYVTGRILGVAHCALCEITHTLTGEKPVFRSFRDALGVPLTLLHRNQQPAELGLLTRGRTPCVVGQGEGGYEVLLGRKELEACRGEVICLEALLSEHLELQD